MTSAQRWRDRRQTMVNTEALFEPRRFAVDCLADRVAKPFVEQHHYSASFPAARLNVGLFRNRPTGSELAGVAVFSVPMNQRSVPKHLGVSANDGVELGRLVLLDDTGLNAESWFVARAFSHLRREKPNLRGVISYSDPVPRQDLHGQTVLPGHVGIVYQALNAVHAGRSEKRTLLLGRSGRVISQRAIAKIRNGEQGREYAERQLLEEGAPPRLFGEDPADWLKRSCSEFRYLRHPGNLVYLWGFDRSTKVHIEQKGIPYPRRAGPA